MNRPNFVPKYGTNNPSYRHGMAGTPTYKLWIGILSRCYNPKVKIFRYYGGKGIFVCQEWHNFVNFYQDMGNRPQGKQLDRIDNNKGYSKDNCRWVTPRENNPIIKGDFIDKLIGNHYGKRTVISYSFSKNKQRHYLCRCDCGKESIVASQDIKRGSGCRDCKNISHRQWWAKKRIEKNIDIHRK